MYKCQTNKKKCFYVTQDVKNSLMESKVNYNHNHKFHTPVDSVHTVRGYIERNQWECII